MIPVRNMGSGGLAAFGEALRRRKCEKLLKKLQDNACQDLEHLMSLYLPGECASIREEGYKRGLDRMAFELELKLKSMGMTAARVMENKLAGLETDAKWLVCKIPISNAEALSMMYGPKAKKEAEVVE